MTDNTGNEQQRPLLTEEQIIELFRRFRAEEQANYQQPREEQLIELFRRLRTEEQTASQQAREERDLPLDITSTLENLTKQQHLDNFKRYKRDVSNYYNEEWTIPEEINKSFIPKLKNYTVDTTQVVNADYKGADISRMHGRAATEIYEQLLTIKNGHLPTEKAQQLLDETIESTKRLSIHAWFQARQFDEDARLAAAKALKLPPSLKHWESKESNKREAFSPEFVDAYHEASFQQGLLRAATNNNSYSNRRGRGWSNNGRNGYMFRGRGKNYQGGRGRGASTFHNNNIPNNYNNTTQNESSNNNN